MIIMSYPLSDAVVTQCQVNLLKLLSNFSIIIYAFEPNTYFSIYLFKIQTKQKFIHVQYSQR